MSARMQRGFTMVELVVAIAIASVVVVFVGMFLTAPLRAFESQSLRNVMVGSSAGAWPRLEEDLRKALPNSVRTLRNGNYIVIEMLTVAGMSRNTSAPGASFGVAGTAAALFTEGLPLTQPDTSNYYLAVNNPGGAAGYTQVAGARPTLNWSPSGSGNGQVNVVSGPIPTGTSPNNRVYLLQDRAAVTYLCDVRAGQGTLRRYSNYAIAASQAVRSAPGNFAGATDELVARGLTNCIFRITRLDASTPQMTSAQLTFSRNTETLTLTHTVRGQYRP